MTTSDRPKAEAWIDAQLRAKAEAKETRIVVLRRILKNKQHEKIDGVLVDTTTASLLVKVYDSISKPNQAKFDRIPLKKLVDFAWSLTK